MTRLQLDLLRAKGKAQTRMLMFRHRVWYIDTPRGHSLTVDRWWKA